MNTLLCFLNGYGFINYETSTTALCFTWHIDHASEAGEREWKKLMKRRGYTEFTLLQKISK